MSVVPVEERVKNFFTGLGIKSLDLVEKKLVGDPVTEVDFKIKVGQRKNLVDEEKVLEDGQGDGPLVGSFKSGNITEFNDA